MTSALSPQSGNNWTPPDILQDSAINVIIQFLQQQGSSRGPYKLERDGTNQLLPGVTLPAVFVQAINMLANHPALGYGGDRPALHRNFLFQALMANVVVLSEEAPKDDVAVRFGEHIVNAEINLRSEMYIEEMNMNFIEDLAIAAGSLELRISTGSREAVFQLLEKLFKFIRSLSDRVFWQPALLRLMGNVPEIQEAMSFLREDLKYTNDPDFQAWSDLLTEEEE